MKRLDGTSQDALKNLVVDDIGLNPLFNLLKVHGVTNVKLATQYLMASEFGTPIDTCCVELETEVDPDDNWKTRGILVQRECSALAVFVKYAMQDYLIASTDALKDADINDFEMGWGQCLAELVAAQKINADADLQVYGIVTDGDLWQ